MKKSILVYCLLVSMQTSAKIIMVDNTALLQQADILTLTKEVFKDISGWRIPLLLPRAASFESQFFSLLNRMPMRHTHTGHTILYQGKKVPRIMEQWTINALTSSQTLDMVNRYINSSIKDSTQKQLNQNLARMSFDPAIAPQLFAVDNNLLSLLARCKRNGHTIVLATNWNEQILHALANKHRSAYTIFDDLFLASPTRSKPQKAFFEQIYTKYGVAPSECITIETEHKFAQEAQKIGITTSIYTGTIQSIEQALHSFKVL